MKKEILISIQISVFSDLSPYEKFMLNIMYLATVRWL